MLFSAQYWKLSKGGNLVNKSGKWQYSSIKWSIPKEHDEGKIMDISSFRVLGKSNETFVEFKTYKVPAINLVN